MNQHNELENEEETLEITNLSSPSTQQRQKQRENNKESSHQVSIEL
jgi:hypothetical protein